MTTATSVRRAFDRHDATSLLWNELAAVGFVIVGNAIVFALGWNDDGDSGRRAEFAPPGYVIGGVWILLFSLMGAARWVSVTAGGDAARNGWLVTGLIVLCWLFPFYTGGLDNEYIALGGTLVTLVVTLAVIQKLRRDSLLAVTLLVPLVAWLAFATAITVRNIQLN